MLYCQKGRAVDSREAAPYQLAPTWRLLLRQRRETENKEIRESIGATQDGANVLLYIFLGFWSYCSLTKGARSSIARRKSRRISKTNDMAPKESPHPRPRERSRYHEKKRASRSHAKSRHETSSSQSGSQLLSANALAKLNQLNQQPARTEEVTPQKKRRKRHREVVDERLVVEKSRRQHKRKKRRVVSGALLEEGDSRRLKGLRGGDRYEEYDGGDKRRKRLCMPLPVQTLDIGS